MTYRDDKSGSRVALVHRGAGFSIVATSGIIAAGLAQDSLIFSMKHNAIATTKRRVFLSRYVVEFTTITAFAVPVVAARRLSLYRGAGTTPTGGTPLTPAQMDTVTTVPAVDNLVDVRIAAAGGLGAGGFVREANPLDVMSLVHVGAAGGYRDRAYSYHGSAAPQILNPDEAWVISNPVAMDAGGTFQIAIAIDFVIADQLT